MNLGIVCALAVGTYALRLIGPLLRGRVHLGERAEWLLSVGAITLLGAFVATEAATESGDFAGLARLAGVIVGGALAWRRAPFILAVPAAAATTAVLRLLGWS